MRFRSIQETESHTGGSLRQNPTMVGNTQSFRKEIHTYIYEISKQVPSHASGILRKNIIP